MLDELGRLLATGSFPTTRHGYRRLLRWLCSDGELVAVGVERCGSWGAELARFLAARGVSVVEVNRPNRQNRRRRGKSDPVDAEATARVGDGLLQNSLRLTAPASTSFVLGSGRSTFDPGTFSGAHAIRNPPPTTPA